MTGIDIRGHGGKRLQEEIKTRTISMCEASGGLGAIRSGRTISRSNRGLLKLNSLKLLLA